jgi:hypothetical protein
MKTQSIISNYTAGPIFMKKNKQGAHEWIIEFEKEPENFDYFCECLDNALKEENSDYEAKRYKNMTLLPPKIHKAERGLFYRWLLKKGKLGGQHKVPRLSNSREALEELLKLNY